MGQAVRYDGSDNKQPQLLKVLNQHFSIEVFCPEMAIGLGVPREPIHLVEIAGDIRCIGTQSPELDVTQQLTELAMQHYNQHQQLSGYIFKRGSPSCGSQNVKLIKNQLLERTARGLYAQQLMRNFPAMPVLDEDQLQTPQQQQDFIHAVVDYHQSVAQH